MTPRAVPAVAVLLAAILSACSGKPIYRDFVYHPQALQGAPETDLKIALLPFADDREEHDSGSHAWNYLPGVLYATESSDDRQTEADRHGSDYYFPDLLPYTLALDLVSNGVSRRVDFSPPALEDYDVVIHGMIHSTELRNQKYSYGLGPASFLTQAVGLPQGEQAALYDVSYRVYTGDGEKVGELRVQREWSPLYWDEDQVQPKIQGVVENVQSGNEEALAWVVATLGRAPITPYQETIDRRIRTYHERLDPNLAGLITERDRARSDPGMGGYAEMVDDEIHRRARLLEKYRRVEQKVIAKQQEFVYDSQYRRLAQLGEYRAAQRQAASSARRAREQHERAQKQRLSSALVGGLIPLMNSMSSYNANDPSAAQSAAMDAAVLRAGQSFSSYEEPPPPPDMNEMMQGIEMDMGDHGAAGASLGGISGNNIVKIRERFLVKYRGQARTIGELREAYLRRRG